MGFPEGLDRGFPFGFDREPVVESLKEVDMADWAAGGAADDGAEEETP